MIRGTMENKIEDRRMLRSRKQLGNALVELMQEKRFIDITVQDIIDRADVGRTTFYKYFQDKEDLLMSNLETILENFIRHMDSTDEDQKMLSTVDFFRHVMENKELYKAMLGGQGTNILFNKGQAVMSQKIEMHLALLPMEKTELSVPLPVLTNFLAGSFLILLKWWFEHKMTYTPEQMDDMYQQLVMPGTLNVLGALIP
jgi:AcrR family transcriptional regulator